MQAGVLQNKFVRAHPFSRRNFLRSGVMEDLDSAICLKSSYGLGYARATDNVTITGCQVSGYTMGTFLDGSYQFSANGGGTGRIKFGTESNGGFRNITISNSVFVHCNGLAIESVDGAVIEDVTISNISMEHISNPPIFVRLGARMRGPEHIPIKRDGRWYFKHRVITTDGVLPAMFEKTYKQR